VAQRIQPPRAQSEPPNAGRECAFVARAGDRVRKALDQFPVVRGPVDLRPRSPPPQARCPPLSPKCRRVWRRAESYASSPLARRIADLRSFPTADQSCLRPFPGYRGVSVCAELTRVEAPNPRISPEKKPPDVDRRLTTPPLRLRLRWSALATVGSSILSNTAKCAFFRLRARCSCSAWRITLRSRIRSLPGYLSWRA
jgi:hypothetical protein